MIAFRQSICRMSRDARQYKTRHKSRFTSFYFIAYLVNHRIGRRRTGLRFSRSERRLPRANADYGADSLTGGGRFSDSDRDGRAAAPPSHPAAALSEAHVNSPAAAKALSRANADSEEAAPTARLKAKPALTGSGRCNQSGWLKRLRRNVRRAPALRIRRFRRHRGRRR